MRGAGDFSTLAYPYCRGRLFDKVRRTKASMTARWPDIAWASGAALMSIPPSTSSWRTRHAFLRPYGGDTTCVAHPCRRSRVCFVPTVRLPRGARRWRKGIRRRLTLTSATTFLSSIRTFPRRRAQTHVRAPSCGHRRVDDVPCQRDFGNVKCLACAPRLPEDGREYRDFRHTTCCVRFPAQVVASS